MSAVRRGRPAPLLLPPGTCPALRQRRAALPALGAAPVGAAGSWLVPEGKASFPGSAPAPRCLRGRELCSSLGKQAWRGSRRSCRALGIFDGYQYSQKLGMGVEPLVSESVEDQDEVPPCHPRGFCTFPQRQPILLAGGRYRDDGTGMRVRLCQLGHPVPASCTGMLHADGAGGRMGLPRERCAPPGVQSRRAARPSPCPSPSRAYMGDKRR